MKQFLTTITRTKMLCIVTGLVISLAGYGQSANILITPASSIVTIGQSFTVNVRVDMQSGACNAAEIHLNFDPSYLRITNITRPSSSTFSSETISLPASPYTAANTAGHLEYAAGIPSGSISADFDILTITFSTPLSSPLAGNTSLTFQNTAGHRTRTVLNGSPLSGTLTDGTVTVQNCIPPTATLSPGASSSTCNAQPVSLRLSSATGTGPYNLVVNGNSYTNKNVGDVIDVFEFPTYNFWLTPPVPDQVNNQEQPVQSIEVGVKFRSSVAGFIKGIRYYVGSSGVSQSHTGKIYNAGTGTLVGSALFTPNASGWQQVLFTTPLLITANTTYIASVYSPSGFYNESDDIFTSTITNGPLTVLADAPGLPNGLYKYGAGMPINGFSKTNYFVDVIFAQGNNTFNLTSVTDATGCNNTGSLQTLNVTSFDCSTLPITLLNLSASPNGKKVTLHWSTSSEINNRGFDIQRSTDGSNWTTIGFVAGVGNSSLTTNYSYLDDNLESRKYYYRLNQKDLDGRSKLSVIVTATVGGRGEYVLGQNYPNPFQNETTIQYSIPQAGKVNVTLFDISGRAVRVLVNGSKEAGTHAISLNTGTLTKGIYYYRLQAGDFSDVKKLTIQ